MLAITSYYAFSPSHRQGRLSFKSDSKRQIESPKSHISQKLGSGPRPLWFSDCFLEHDHRTG